jgi:hypothetical protein
MPLGIPHDRTEVYLNDSAELTPYIYDSREQPVQQADLASVEFEIKKPDGSVDIVAGTIESDGSGFLRYLDTDQVGLYVWVAQFTFDSGEKRSYRDEFKVIDPLTVPPQTRVNKIAEKVWLKLEDCFDSDLGGPWLRNETLAYFEPTKIEKFISQGLLTINVYPPMTTLDLSFFTIEVPDSDPALPPGSTQADPDEYIIVQATLLAVIKHLMRSYVEQPDVRGANIVYEDRRDYLQRWQIIYQIEEASINRALALWKRQFLNLGKSSLLVHSKAGRLYPPGHRARNAQRGYY